MTIQQFDLVKLEAITAIQQDLENTVEAFSITAENASALAVAANVAAEAAASASGDVLFYDTKAAANGALSGLSEGQIVEVMADESVSGLRTRYRKTSGAYVFKIVIGEAKVSTVAALRAIPYSAMLTTAQTLGVSSVGDGGGGVWRWDAASTVWDNVGTVIKPTGHDGAGRWVREFTGAVHSQWFGSDNVALQAAFDTAIDVVIDAGHEILLDNTPVTVSTAGQKITSFGTVKLKDRVSAVGSVGQVLTITAANVILDGGTWDGNRAGNNTPASTYNSWCISCAASGITIKNTICKNAYGIGIKGASPGSVGCSNLSFLNNTISGTTHYGIFVDGGNNPQYYNRAIGNYIDVTQAGALAQGILFAGADWTTNCQFYWQIHNNTVVNTYKTSTNNQEICLGVRGNNGSVIGNTTYKGAMGWSEGGSNTIIANNNFYDCQWGIELSGGFNTISGNLITGCNDGITATATASSADVSNTVISGNQIYCKNTINGVTSTSHAIKVRCIDSVVSSRMITNMLITNNVLHGSYGVYIYGNKDDGFTQSVISNNIIGNPSDAAGSTGIMLADLQASLKLTIRDNKIFGPTYWMRIYAAVATEFTDLFIDNIQTDSAYVGAVTVVVNATIGRNVLLRNLNSTTELKDIVDVKNNIYHAVRPAGTLTPEGRYSAGIGSTYLLGASAGGAATTLYVKETGTGNTGWVAK